MREFYDLITAYSWTRDPSRKAAIGRDIWKWYGAEKAALVIDLSGFTKGAVDRNGILGFLAVIRRMQTAANPIVWSHQGEVVKMEADNCFAVFDSPIDAARAALELVEAGKSIRARENIDTRFCCGLEFGEILYIPEQDFFGLAVNNASKLGEDSAKADEVLAGPMAAKMLADAGWRIKDYAGVHAPEGSVEVIAPPPDASA